MALMFTTTPRITKAVGFINDLDSSRFPLLLSRILNKLHLKDERAFSEEEEEKLQGAFDLAGHDLDLVIETCEFFLQQAAYHIAKPSVLAQQLQNIEVSEEKVKVICEAWSGSAKEVVEKLRQRSFSQKQLEDVKWRLGLQMAQATQTKMKIPNASFELGINNDGEKEKVRLEFTHDELSEFYNQLERIQSQVDSLS